MFGESWTVIFADTRSTVLLFETILPTRDYIDPGDAAFEHVEPSSMQKLYPYTGGGYWATGQCGRDTRCILFPGLAST
ncbi:hypothetical protein DIJ64_01430 [Mycobacterium leprae]|uniref:DUF427 domain-containing protein n=1 Tax=Mycobacterium leprae TaxID=1769 RepID=A0AAD0KRB0_MYCLR|nr:hypothetical protein DIJ64_01430 [Mycobacterium leprae]